MILQVFCERTVCVFGWFPLAQGPSLLLSSSGCFCLMHQLSLTLGQAEYGASSPPSPCPSSVKILH